MKDVITKMMDTIDADRRANGVVYTQEELYELAIDVLTTTESNDEHASRLTERLYDDWSL